jgi:hypothetical protein
VKPEARTVGLKLRILQRFATGDRVRAVLTIFYARPEATIDEGELGTVTGLSFCGVDAVVDVRWDVGAEWDKFRELSFPTSVDCLEPVPNEDNQRKR